MRAEAGNYLCIDHHLNNCIFDCECFAVHWSIIAPFVFTNLFIYNGNWNNLKFKTMHANRMDLPLSSSVRNADPSNTNKKLISNVKQQEFNLFVFLILLLPCFKIFLSLYLRLFILNLYISHVRLLLLLILSILFSLIEQL